jgi:elongation factor Ts
MISTDDVKKLRDMTGISVMQCRKALEEAGGDFDKAIVILQKRGAEIAAKKAGRTLGAGVVSSYIHATGTVGAMVELYCETDFVSGNDEFKKLAYDIAMHITASNPEFLKTEDITKKAKDLAKGAFIKEVEGKPIAMKKKILEGKLKSYFAERVLLEQPFIKNPELTIRALIDGAIQKFGEKIEIGRFVRFSVKR